MQRAVTGVWLCSLVSLLLVSEDEVFLEEWSLGGECQQRRHFTYTSHHQQQVCCGTPEHGNRFVPAPGPGTGEITRSMKNVLRLNPPYWKIKVLQNSSRQEGSSCQKGRRKAVCLRSACPYLLLPLLTMSNVARKT